MKLSIILATCNRSDIIVETLNSINKIELSSLDSIEVIIIDQSFDFKTYDVARKFEKTLDILYVHALKKGLSHSRNIGLDLVSGDLICFGDDDGTYSADLLSKLNLYSQKLDFIGGAVYEPFTQKLTDYTKANKKYSINRLNMSGLITSISIFIKSDFIKKHNMYFDEKLGLGADFSSCEELDLVYRLLSYGAEAEYYPSIKVFHKNPDGYDKEKTELYAKGHGAFCYKLYRTKDLIGIYIASIKVLKSLLKFPISLFKKNKYFPISFWKGFIFGFKNYI